MSLVVRGYCNQQDIQRISSAIIGTPIITSLSLKMKCNSIAALCRAIEVCKSLRSVDINGDTDSARLSRAILANQNIESFTYECLMLGDSFEEDIGRMYSLKHLKLTSSITNSFSGVKRLLAESSNLESLEFGILDHKDVLSLLNAESKLKSFIVRKTPMCGRIDARIAEAAERSRIKTIKIQGVPGFGIADAD